MKRVGKLNQVAVAVALVLGTTSAAQAVLYEVSSFTGRGLEQQHEYSFDITAPGLYKATLTDLGFFAPFDALALAVVKNFPNGSPLAGFIASPGSFTFDVTTTGPFKAFVGGTVAASGGVLGTGFYSVNVSLVPEPEAWAMMLVGMGLVGWQLRRKVKASAASRFV